MKFVDTIRGLKNPVAYPKTPQLAVIGIFYSHDEGFPSVIQLKIEPGISGQVGYFAQQCIQGSIKKKEVSGDIVNYEVWRGPMKRVGFLYDEPSSRFVLYRGEKNGLMTATESAFELLTSKIRKELYNDNNYKL